MKFSIKLRVIIIQTKFRKGILSQKKFFLQQLDFDRFICMIAMYIYFIVIKAEDIFVDYSVTLDNNLCQKS